MTMSLPVLADSDHLKARRLVESGEIMPLEKILERLQDNAAGQVLEIQLESEDGSSVYEIEWLDANGQVWEWKIDARNGQRISQERE